MGNRFQNQGAEGGRYGDKPACESDLHIFPGGRDLKIADLNRSNHTTHAASPTTFPGGLYRQR